MLPALPTVARRLRLRTAGVWLALAFGPLLAVQTGCTQKDVYKDEPVEVLYNRGMEELNAGDSQKASKDFDEVDRQHPESSWATKAQLMSAYALYQGNKLDEAVPVLDRFIQLHPGHRDVAYAYYLKAICYYEQIADVARDQADTQRALAALQDVLTRFPNSRYARDAKFKLDLARDHLAGKEMSIGRFYEQQREYLAAINRFRAVIDNFQTTSQVPEALERLVECYSALGLTDEAQKTAAVLGYNYPGTDWYQDAYKLVIARSGSAAMAPSAESTPRMTQISTANGGSAPPPPGSSGWFGWLGNLW
jgi:outer membrane protein assembly factor BamD